MKLYHKALGEGEVLIILHGLMGMLDNWQSPAQVYSQHFRTHLLDARNHGHSPHSDEFSYELMVADLLEFMDNERIERAHLLGHSMGGKTVMKFAQNHPERVRKLIVADIGPKAYPVHHEQILAALKEVDFSQVDRRSQIEPILEKRISEWGVRQFLLKNVYWKEKGKLAYRFNLDAIDDQIDCVGDEIEDAEYTGETLFIRGSKSNYILDYDWPDIRLTFPNAVLETVEGANHWLHADKPEEFNAKVLKFLLD
ncbi:alpha/beta fold hydrolase [Salibacteraceae bacterium]|jgi:pimeloyl-ACP methyl ester carboxylesterase|nr:alpha/beta fold hydrolase [Salibacteraceae bacterium]